MTILILSVFLAVGFSFICSITEACLLSISLSDIVRIGQKHKAIAKIWRSFRDNIRNPIGVILLINTIANAFGGAMSGAKFAELFGPRFAWLFSLCFCALIIQWGEILPKTLGVRYNVFVAIVTAIPLKIGIRIFKPLLWLVELINKPFAKKVSRHNTAATDTLNEIALLARFATENSYISIEQENIVSRSMKLSTTTVADIMVKRSEIKFLTTSMSLSDALIAAHIHRHTRYPLVKENDLNQLLGYVNFKDIVMALRINPQQPSLEGIVRPIMQVSPGDKLSTVLTRMTAGRNHIAVVKDSADMTVGLVTLEDLIEEVVGDIQDEYDLLPQYIEQKSKRIFEVGGGCTYAQLRNAIPYKLPLFEGTIDKWLRSKLHKYPKEYDRITLEGWELTVIKVRRSKIYLLTLELKNITKN